jgi:peptidoglycan/LPS O-acetylase OafA/YrhL
MPIETGLQFNQASDLALNARAAAALPKSQRIAALDFTKGVLVLVMVLYHWINYFIGPQWKYYFYLRFLTPSFIFITGFMISHVYLAKYAPTDPRLSKRLLARGLKLFTIFLALNVARSLVVPLLGTGVAMQNLPSPGTLFTVFVSGNFPVVGTKLVSFSILVPISYLLIAAGVLIFPYRNYKYTFHVACGVLLLSIEALALAGIRIYNLEFVAIGMLGVVTGFAPIRVINGVGRYPYLVALAYLGYLTAITVWNVPFLLLIPGVLLNLSVVYLAGLGGSETNRSKNEVILLGKYSLLGYISQLAFLQILRAALSRMHLGFAALPVSFVAAFALTILSVEIVDRARARSGKVERLYRAVFA